MGFALYFLTFQVFTWQLLCNAQTFKWAFSDTTLSTDLSSCATLPITITDNAGTKGIAPFYMIALEAGGTPTTTLLKDNSWQVNHAVGSSLMLSVVDSAGNAGGTSASIYTIISGDSKGCITKASNSGFSITANVTKELSTCEAWGIQVVGGVAPYNLTIAALGAPSVTNVTMEPGTDIFTYINRASPNGQLFAAISDSTGKWASGATLVKTAGSSDTECAGLASSGSSSGSGSSPGSGSSSGPSGSPSGSDSSVSKTTASLSKTITTPSTPSGGGSNTQTPSTSSSATAPASNSNAAKKLDRSSGVQIALVGLLGVLASV